MRLLAHAAGLVLAAAAPAGTQQTSPCRSADSASVALVDHISVYTAATDSAFIAERIRLGYPALPSTQLPELVTEAKVCKAAADAYARTVPGPRDRLSGRVYVVQAGSTYTVVDPDYYERAPGAWSIRAFSAGWVLLSK